MPHVVYTKPRQEHRANKHLAQQGVMTFLPMCRTERDPTPKPLFPRYLFVWFRGLVKPIGNTPGVSRLLMSGDEPAVVPDAVVEDIVQQMKEGGGVIMVNEGVSPRKVLEPGQPIRIVGGSYIGLEGLYVGRAKDRVVALLDMFGRRVKANVSEKHVA